MNSINFVVLGEQTIANDFGKKDGIISHSYEVDENRLNSMIKGTEVESFLGIHLE